MAESLVQTVERTKVAVFPLRDVILLIASPLPGHLRPTEKGHLRRLNFPIIRFDRQRTG